MFELPNETLAAKFVIKTHYIVKVLAFYPETQTVDLIQDTFEFANAPFGVMQVMNDFGKTITVGIKKPDVLEGVPVKQLRWGQFEIQCCPVPGDTGYIEVFTNDIRDWAENGGPSIPWNDLHFLKESCVFVPFIPNKANASTTYPADNSQLVIKSTNASIVITDKPAEEGSEEEPTVDITTTAQTLNINAEKGITVTGDINITGNITATGDITVEGTITASGDITSTEGDVVASGISLKNHTHNIPTGAVLVQAQAGVPNKSPIEITAPVKQE